MMRELLNAHFILSLCFCTMAFLMILGLFFLKIPDDNANLINTALGFVAGWVSSSTGYYFVKTSKNEQKGETDA